MSSTPLYLAIVAVWLIVLVPMLLRRDAADPAPTPLRRSGGRGEDGDGVDDRPDDDALDDEDDEDRPDAAERPDVRVDAARRATAEADGADDGPTGGDDPDGPEDPGRTRPLRRRSGRAGAPEAPDHVMSEHAEIAPPRPRVSRARVIARRRRRTSGLTALLVGTGVAVGLGLGPWWVLAPPVVLLVGHLALLREAAKADAERRAAERRYRRRRAEIRARRAAEEAAAREAEVIELLTRRDQVYDQYTDAHQRAAGD